MENGQQNGLTIAINIYVRATDSKMNSIMLLWISGITPVNVACR